MVQGADTHPQQLVRAVVVVVVVVIIITSLPKVIWEQGRVAAAVPGVAGIKD